MNFALIISFMIVIWYAINTRMENQHLMRELDAVTRVMHDQSRALNDLREASEAYKASQGQKQRIIAEFRNGS